MPLLELRHRRDALRRRVRGDGLRRGLQESVPARQTPQIIQLLLDGRRAREPLREGEGGVCDAVYFLTSESLRLVQQHQWWYQPRARSRGVKTGLGRCNALWKEGGHIPRVNSCINLHSQKFLSNGEYVGFARVTCSLVLHLGSSFRDFGGLPRPSVAIPVKI